MKTIVPHTQSLSWGWDREGNSEIIIKKKKKLAVLLAFTLLLSNTQMSDMNAQQTEREREGWEGGVGFKFKNIQSPAFFGYSVQFQYVFLKSF